MNRPKEGTVAFREYLVNVLNGMALGLFSSLIIGLILKQLGTLLGVEQLLRFGTVAQYLMGPAIGAGVAFSVKAPPLGLFAAIVAGAIGAGTVAPGASGIVFQIGEPVGALVASLSGAEFARRIAGRTGVDIVLVPACTILVGGLVGITAGPVVAKGMALLGDAVNLATRLHPLPMGILVAVLMGMILTLPISSAALSISLGLSGLAAGAATVGCACQMIGFAVQSYRENGLGGLLSQGLGTSMLQMPNIVRNPWIWVPPTLAGACLGPVATVLFRMENSRIGAGMGTSGLVGQLATLDVMGAGAWPGILLLHFLLPAVLTLVFAAILRRWGLVRDGDMKLSR